MFNSNDQKLFTKEAERCRHQERRVLIVQKHLFVKGKMDFITPSDHKRTGDHFDGTVRHTHLFSDVFTNYNLSEAEGPRQQKQQLSIITGKNTTEKLHELRSDGK